MRPATLQTWLIGAALALAVVAHFAVRWPELARLRGPKGYVLAGPDCYMHWRLVTRALAGEWVRIRWMTEDNAPWGRPNEWTSPMTIVSVAGVRLVEAVTGWPRTRALDATRLWLGPVIGLAGLLLLAWLGWRTGGAWMALAWVAVWVALKPAISPTGFSNTDHHGLNQVLAILMLGGTLAWARQPTRAGGVFLGLVSAVGLWSAGSELLPAWGLVAGAAAWEVAHQQRVEFWRWWSRVGLVGVLSALVFEFWPGVWQTQLEILSVWHLALACIAAALVEFLSREARADRQRLAVLGAILVALFTAGAVRGFDWGALHVMFDERFALHAVNIVELESFGRFGVMESFRYWWWALGLLPVVVAAGAARWQKLSWLERWWLVGAVVFLGLTLQQRRWDVFLAVALAMGGGLVVNELWPRWRWVGLAGLVGLTLPPWWVAARQCVSVRNEDWAENVTARLELVSDCLGQHAPGAIVLAPWDQGSVLAGLGQVRVVGSGYWSNLAGLMDEQQLLTTESPEVFWGIVKRRGIEYLLVREPPAFLFDLTLAGVVVHGRIPADAEVRRTVVWRVAALGQAEAVECPELARVAPEWRIIPLRRTGGSE
jgi:hypothetical protein